MSHSSRREFLATVGQGMLIAGVGYGAACELGLTRSFGEESPNRLTFGKHQPLVDLLCETPLDRLQSTLLGKLQQGTTPRDLIAAAALTNARAFGGEDYIGFHTLMALTPALKMSEELSGPAAALPVLKVLYRNCQRFHEVGGGERLQPVTAISPNGTSAAAALQNAVHQRDVNAAEATLASSAASSAADAFNDLLWTVEEATEVHRVVLAHRAWDMLDLVGQEHALTMLRQSVRYCVKNEESTLKHLAEPRTLLPKLLDEFHLPERATGTRTVDDEWIAAMSQTLFTSTPSQAAHAAAAAIAEGVPTAAICAAVSITANQLVLRDGGRVGGQIQPKKPAGSVHGDSIGVHASDTAHAWRGIAAASNARNRVASTILAAYQVALDRSHRGGDFQVWQPRPLAEDVAKLTATSPEDLLNKLDDAIRSNDQAAACAAAHKYGAQGHSPAMIFQRLLQYAVSEDGALHAEKYFRTTRDEFANLSPRFRWGQVVALARVSASCYGQPAAGMDEAKRLLKLV